MKTESIEQITRIGAIGLLAAFRGWLGWLVLLYGTVLAADWITGTTLAIKEKTWSSSRARQGLWNKCGSIITVCVAVLTDILLGLVINNIPTIHLPFQYNTILCPIVLVWYIVSELGSILENAAHMGAPIPIFLKTVLKKVHQTCETGEGTQQNIRKNSSSKKQK